MRWPVLRFERFFDRHLRRKAKDQLERERDMLIAAVHSNPNWDSSKEMIKAKEERLEGIRRGWKEAVELIYQDDQRGGPPEPDPMEADPLFRPLRNQAQALAQDIARPVATEEGAGAALLG